MNGPQQSDVAKTRAVLSAERIRSGLSPRVPAPTELETRVRTQVFDEGCATCRGYGAVTRAGGDQACPSCAGEARR